MEPAPDGQRSRRRESVPIGPLEDFIVPLVDARVRELLGRAAAARPADARALDVGSGGQPFRGALETAGYAYTSLDLESATPAPDVTGRIDAPLPESLLRLGPFDLILCTEVLEHVPDWAAAFEKFARLLAPGGRLLVTTPFFYHLHEEPWDYWRPTPHELRLFAERNGLRVEALEQAGGIWEVLGTLTATGTIEPRESTLRARLTSTAMNYALTWLRRALRDGRVTARCRWSKPFFLTTAALLSKPKS